MLEEPQFPRAPAMLNSRPSSLLAYECAAVKSTPPQCRKLRRARLESLVGPKPFKHLGGGGADKHVPNVAGPLEARRAQMQCETLRRQVRVVCDLGRRGALFGQPGQHRIQEVYTRGPQTLDHLRGPRLPSKLWHLPGPSRQ